MPEQRIGNSVLPNNLKQHFSSSAAAARALISFSLHCLLRLTICLLPLEGFLFCRVVLGALFALVLTNDESAPHSPLTRFSIGSHIVSSGLYPSQTT